MLDELLTETVSVETSAGHPAPLLKEIQDRLNAILKEIQVELQGLNVAELKALDEAYSRRLCGARSCRQLPLWSLLAELWHDPAEGAVRPLDR